MPTKSKDTELTPQANEAAVASLELAKQLITLSSGVLALSATFIDKIRPANGVVLFLLIAAWIALIVSVIGALQHISAIVKSRLTPENNWWTGHGKSAAVVSKWGFVVGLFLFVLVAAASLFASPPNSEAPGSVTIVQQARDTSPDRSAASDKK